jgi:hypothetical protein
MIDGMNSELCFRAAHFLAPIFSYRLPLDLDLLDISVRAAPLPWKLLYLFCRYLCHAHFYYF